MRWARNELISSEEWLASLSRERGRNSNPRPRRDRNSAADSVDVGTYERFYGNRKYYEATIRARR
jgi:hypothetical protein